jgi:hypothetical protein
MTSEEQRIWEATYAAAFVAYVEADYHAGARHGMCRGRNDRARLESEQYAESASGIADAAVAGLRLFREETEP